jgi:preprotein translocase subunit SecE
MARDRKRAKQRQRQRRAQQAPARVGADRRQRRPAPASDPLEERIAAPDPLEESSAEVEIAEAAIAQPTVSPEPLDEDEFPSDGDVADELEEEPTAEVRPRMSADGESAVSRARAQPSGAQLPREGNRLLNFFGACWAELQRVQWPDRKAVWQATAVVLVFVVIAGGYLGLWDAVFSRLVDAIL